MELHSSEINQKTTLQTTRMDFSSGRFISFIDIINNTEKGVQIHIGRFAPGRGVATNTVSFIIVDILDSAGATCDSSRKSKITISQLIFRPRRCCGGAILFFATKIKNSKSAAGRGRILTFASYQYLLNTKVQNSTFGRASVQILKFNFDSYQYF